jgi:hypothetical protein
MSKLKIVGIGITLIQFFLLSLTAIALITHWLGLVWINNEVYTNCQPDNINYESFDPYCIRIFERRGTFYSNKEIWITTKVDKTYGYAIDHPLNHTFSSNYESETSVLWTEQGVELEIGNVTMLIPKDEFIAGR